MDDDLLLDEFVWKLIDLSDGNPMSYVAGFCPPIDDDGRIITVSGHRIELVGSHNLDEFARMVTLNDPNRIEQIRQIAQTGSHVAVLILGNERERSGVYTDVHAVAYVPR